MFKGKISVKYNSDWINDLFEKFECDISIIYTQNINPNEVIDLLKITNLNSRYSFNEIKQFLERYETLKEVECIDETSEYVLIKTLIKMDSLTNNQHFVKNFCFQIGSIEFKDFCEIWTFFSPKKENIKQLIKELKQNKDRTVELLSVTKYSLYSQGLTDKQYFYFEYLFRKGYFEIPKKITLEDAAKDLKTSSVNINKHLNRALKKVANNFFEN